MSVNKLLDTSQTKPWANLFVQDLHVFGEIDVPNISSEVNESTIPNVGEDEDDWGAAVNLRVYRFANRVTLVIKNRAPIAITAASPVAFTGSVTLPSLPEQFRPTNNQGEIDGICRVTVEGIGNTGRIRVNPNGEVLLSPADVDDFTNGESVGWDTISFTYIITD